MNIKNEIENKLDCNFETENPIMISDSIIDTINLGFTTFQSNITIINCQINNLIIHSSWFKNGFTLENCIVKNKIQYEMGGHNDSPIIIRNNIIHGLFVFFDCQFIDKVIIENNIFHNGSTLCGDLTNTFQSELSILNNIGNMHINQIE